MSLPLSASELNILFTQLKPGGGEYDGLNVRSNIYFPSTQLLPTNETKLYKVKIESNVYISDDLVAGRKIVVGNNLTWSNRINRLTNTIDENSRIPTDRSFNALIDGNLFVSNDIMCSGIVKKKKI